jgi:hypothetical protein
MASDDIQEVFDKCKDLEDNDPGFIIKLSMGRCSVDDVKAIIDRMGKVVINIGDGLTLLHVFSLYGNYDVVHYLAGDKHHPLEVRLLYSSGNIGAV